jgi:ATP-dependent DNA helicase RecQ
VQSFFMAGRYPDIEEIVAVYEALRRLLDDGSTAELAMIGKESGVARRKTRAILSMLKQAGRVSETRGARFRLSGGETDGEALEAIAREYREKAESDRHKLEQMMLYGQVGSCRWKFLLDYFGDEADWDHCGNCDNCLNPIESRIGPAS